MIEITTEGMTATQCLMAYALRFAVSDSVDNESYEVSFLETNLTSDNVDSVFQRAISIEDDSDFYYLSIRDQGIPSEVKPKETSRHYEVEEYVIDIHGDGSVLVGFPYWFGGGKHGNASQIDFFDDAYFVVKTQEIKVVNIYQRLKAKFGEQ